jgi:hypothetical protein
MNLRLLLLLPCALLAPALLASASKPSVVEPAADVAPLQPIREFDLETLGKLGREIYRQDQLAWHGTDALSAKIGQAQMAAEHCSGWVVDTSGTEPLLRFVRKAGEAEEAAYDVRFPTDAKPTVSVPENRELTEHQKAIRRAFATATKGFADANLPLCPCRGSYNFVVLDDPAGPGFLVYLLRPKSTNFEIPIGGHYRISVTADGSTVTQIDRLWKTCLSMDKRQAVTSSGKLMAVTVTSVVSAKPLEIHVFLSLQENLAVYVGTSDLKVWAVENGAIRQVNTEPKPAAKAGPAAK